MPRESFKERRKCNQRLLTKDVYKYISDNSSLTAKQIKECFDTYRSMLETIVASEYIDKDITIAMPSLGLFYLKKHRGRKRGSMYRLPVVPGSKEMKTIIVEEDEPDRYKVKFKISKGINVIFEEGNSKIK